MSTPLFGYAGEEHPQRGRRTIRRDEGGHERWADAILPADAAAGTIETPTSRQPLWLIAGLVLLVASLLGAQLFRLQIVGGQRNLGLADGNRLRQQITRAPRGVIYDRDHHILAENLASFDITATPSLLPMSQPQRQRLYAKVGDLLGLPADAIAGAAETTCVNGEKAAHKSAARATYDCLSNTQPRLIASNVARDTALNFDQSSSSVPGFNLDVNPIRQYQDGGSLAAILGYTGRVDQEDLDAHPDYAPTDYTGKLGIEKQYEAVLRGQNGSSQTEVDASGRPIKLLASKPAVAGQNLVLTIDSDLQSHLSSAIQEQMQASGATQAAGIALNPSTGEILATVNLPTYDNNLFAKGISQSDYNQLVKNPAEPLFNKAIAGAFPTGSIIKPLVAAAALQSGVISPNTSVDDTGSITIHNKYDPNITYTYRSYTDYESGYSGSLGIVNVTKAIAVSSDVFFYTVGGGFGNIGGLGIERLAGFFSQFGLGKLPHVDIPEQTAGRVPTPDWKQKIFKQPWTVGDTYNTSIGQGDLLASPLQMAVAEATIANGGKVIQPHFLKTIENANGGTAQTIQPTVLAQNFISADNLNTVRNAMHDVVYQSYGTACCKIAAEVPVQVAAKTGTAQTGTADSDKPDAWFTAFAPYDNPQIEIVVLVEKSGEGAKFAAPAVRETLAYCFSRPGGCVH